MNPSLYYPLIFLHVPSACIWTSAHTGRTGIALRFGGFPFFS